MWERNMKRILLAFIAAIGVSTGATAQIVSSVPYTFQNGTVADATQVNANFNAIVAGVNANVATAGANSNISSLTGLTTPIPLNAGGTADYNASSSSTGTSNAQVISTMVPSGFTLTNGVTVKFTAGATNTGAMTLNVGASGALPVVQDTQTGPVALVGGEVTANNAVVVYYDAANGRYHLINPNVTLTQLNIGAWTNIASASTVDLGAQLTRNIIITGTTTIGSFGSTATPDHVPFYVRFAGVLTLTNGSNLVLPGAANITTSAGDEMVISQESSGVWKVISYTIAAISPYSGIKSGVTQTSTSGTAILFTGIPSGAKRITVMFNSVSTSGTSNIQIQIGSGSVSNTGYDSGAWTANSTNSDSTTGFLITAATATGASYSGNIILSLSNTSTNLWTSSGIIGQSVVPSTNGSGSISGGNKALAGTLDRVVVTTVNGTDTFDAGSINILYE
jgi:hypothetical protein